MFRTANKLGHLTSKFPSRSTVVAYRSTASAAAAVVGNEQQHAAGIPRHFFQSLLRENCDIRPAAADDIFWQNHRGGLVDWEHLDVVGQRKKDAL